jgi:hypothetical protein
MVCKKLKGREVMVGSEGNFLDKRFMPAADEIQNWHVFKDAGGPTFAGSPSWKRYMAFLEENFRASGLIDIKKDTFTYNRWFTSDERSRGDWTLAIDGKQFPVASYWAYSGSTPPSGITAPLVYYDQDNPPTSIEGKIVVFDIPILSPDSLPPEMLNPGFEYASDPDSVPTDSFVTDQFYQVTYYSLFGGLGDILTQGKAAGGLVIADMGPGRAAGIYTLPPPPAEVGVPGLFLDRVAGKIVRQAAMEGRMATLKLIAMREKAEAYFLSGCLPGKNYGKAEDEVVLLLTHTDGPGLSQENGALGILAVIQYFSHLPRNERSRTLLVLLDPQHYMPGRHSIKWYSLHPETASQIVASMGIEHLGQIEYREKGDEFLPTGLPEVTKVFVQDNEKLIKRAILAVQDNRLPRAMVHCPSREGQGMWEGMGDVAMKRHIPGFALSSLMSAYLSTEARINTFDRDLALRQIAVAVQLTGELMKAELLEIAVPQGG